MSLSRAKKNLVIDLAILLASVLFAIWLSQSQTLTNILAASKESVILGSLVGGLFFTSIFTSAPSIVVLGEVAQNSSVWQVALIGSIGALLGDLVMFKFLKDRLATDFYALFHVDMDQRELRLPKFRWFLILIAGLVIASPFPDELGLAILGFSKTNTIWVVFVSLLCNFLGILAISALFVI